MYIVLSKNKKYLFVIKYVMIPWCDEQMTEWNVV